MIDRRARLDELRALLGVTDAPEDREQLEWLESALENYRADLADDGPRVKDLAAGADEIERLTASLAVAIDKFSGGLSNAGIPGNSYLSVGATERIPSAVAEYCDDQQGFLENVRRISALMGRVRAEIIAEFGSGDCDAPDKGGRGGVATRRYGSPKRRFVHELAEVWGPLKGFPYGTTDGEFHRFCLMAHESATGTEARGFDAEVKKAAKEYRLRKETYEKAWKRINHLQRCASAYRSHPMTGDLAAVLERRAARLILWTGSTNFPQRYSRSNGVRTL